jgi:hypothetical protein
VVIGIAGFDVACSPEGIAGIAEAAVGVAQTAAAEALELLGIDSSAEEEMADGDLSLGSVMPLAGRWASWGLQDYPN